MYIYSKTNLDFLLKTTHRCCAKNCVGNSHVGNKLNTFRIPGNPEEMKKL